MKLYPKKLRYTYDELVLIQEYFAKHVSDGNPMMELEDAAKSIYPLISDCLDVDKYIKAIVAIIFLYEIDTGDWVIGETPFTYLECKVKMNKLRRGVSLKNCISYKFVVEE